jgi:hypothetical protein
VATPASIWAEWISSAPLLLLTTFTVVDKPHLSRVDISLIVSFCLCLIFGFLIIGHQPGWLAWSFLFMSFSLYLPLIYLPWYSDSDEASSASMLPIALQMWLVEMQARRYRIHVWLTISLPLYSINYLLALLGCIGYASTVVSFQILSLLTKSIFATMVMDLQVNNLWLYFFALFR